MRATRRIVVTGATGLVGRPLCAELVGRGDSVVVLAQGPEQARELVPGAADYAYYQATETLDGVSWPSYVDGADAVVALASAPIVPPAGERFTAEYLAYVQKTRVLGVRGAVEAIRRASHRPRVLVSASAVGFYGLEPSDVERDEISPAGIDGYARDVVEWENAAREAADLQVRTVLLRTGFVLSSQREGALARMAGLMEKGLGGPIAPGDQWRPWIHLADEVGLALLAIDDERATGPLNCVAPCPLTERQFEYTLGLVLGHRSWLRKPELLVRMALGEGAVFLTRGKKVWPRHALELGYQFRYPSLDLALRNLLGREHPLDITAAGAVL